MPPNFLKHTKMEAAFWVASIFFASFRAARSGHIVVGAVACPARGCLGVALGNSGGASPSPTHSSPRNAARFRACIFHYSFIIIH